MAESFTATMLERFESILKKEEQLLIGFGTGVRDIREELDSIKTYLRESDATDEREGEKTCMRHLRDIAYDIEDVLEEFMLHFGQFHGNGLAGFLRKSFHYIKNLGTLHRIAIQIKMIRIRIGNTLKRRNMYTAIMIEDGTSSAAVRDRLYDSHVASLFTEEAELVGIDEPREELIGWLVQGGSQLKVISVVGMGGLGKTTLVRKVYDNERVKALFLCHAWITVTQSFTYEELLRRIIKKIFKERNEQLPESISKMTCIALTETLRNYLMDKSCSKFRQLTVITFKTKISVIVHSHDNN